jgi:hypothetical protein
VEVVIQPKGRYYSGLEKEKPQEDISRLRYEPGTC